MLKVHFTNRQNLLAPPRESLTRLLRMAAPTEWEKAELSVVFVDRKEMADLNRQHAGRAGETDVLAFPYDLVPAARDRLLGEIVVCVSLAQEEAQARAVCPEDELALYVLHGMLHLLGYDDRRPKERRTMHAREVEILRQVGIPNVRRFPRRKSVSSAPAGSLRKERRGAKCRN